MEQTKSKNWKGTLSEVRKLCSFHEFEMIINSINSERFLNSKSSAYDKACDKLDFFKRGLEMAYRQEGYEERWIEVLLKMIDVLVYEPHRFECDAEWAESYQEFVDKLEYERSQVGVVEELDYEDYGAKMDGLLGG